ncbi:hypothetical protein AMJ87_12480 [candidate division WOR_3 bacterium SM23_60]|uniref:TonB-dependent receptor-like beta-barrel domain-containing protein n=1 Tax=candidate division WOR_3 bacterium SM23_60 TaxID=1703780 RepID=A0A0S8G652_UNCW3|nr:MAG: hypothetical protein AMJ87_12480 [candidate division WOR_3 bacterium SM23_60]
MTYVLTALVLFGSTSGKIQGVVTDEDTNEPIPYVNITILNTDIGTATDNNGYFHIVYVLPGTYTVEVSCIGYQTKRIQDVVVEIDQTVRLSVGLFPTLIEMEPVTVISEKPAVKKDMVSTTYIIREDEIATIPVDYSFALVRFQPAVAIRDTALHVRGGRETEVTYLIDNISIMDPQSGELAIVLSKGIIDEIIFLPGGFDAEYGRAMSGVINMIAARPSERLQIRAYGKTEALMPYYYDFGYGNVQTSIHTPLTKQVRGFFAFDAAHTDDWNPKLYVLPHKQRDDYSIYGKLLFAPSGKLRINVSGAQSRMQFDRYNTLWKFNLDHYRSDMRAGNLEVINVKYTPSARSLLTVDLSRLHTELTFGVREPGSHDVFDNFQFCDHLTLEWPRASTRNPFGVYARKPYSAGDYPEYGNKSSLVYKLNTQAILQLHTYHELQTGFEYAHLDLENFHYFVSNTFDVIDSYHYKPREVSAFVQDNIDFAGAFVKAGMRFDYYSSDIDSIDPKLIIAPRLGASFLVTEKFLFRANYGVFTQPPLYDHMYSFYNLLPLPPYLEEYYKEFVAPVGNPDLNPEKTSSFEIGLQGEVQENVNMTVNTFYKDVTDLIGTRFVSALPVSYIQYINVEYANIKGIETILDFETTFFNGKVSYTLSWARGSSSYAEEVYRQYAYDELDTAATPPLQEYDLDFDQRHRVFIQGAFNFPFDSQLFVFGYFGQGFPYTPPSPEGKTEERNVLRLDFQRQIDCVFTKSLTIGNLVLTAYAEVINVLDIRYPLGYHYPLIPYEDIKPWEFDTYSFQSSYYSPAADLNHDGLITPAEQVVGYRELALQTDDWVNVNSAPRRARIGFEVKL